MIFGFFDSESTLEFLYVSQSVSKANASIYNIIILHESINI